MYWHRPDSAFTVAAANLWALEVIPPSLVTALGSYFHTTYLWRKKLKSCSSYDSDFWSSKADLLDMDSRRVEMFSHLEFDAYQAKGGDLSYPEWVNAETKAQDLLRESFALKQQEKIARRQAESLKTVIPIKPVRDSFVKLFNSSKLGFGIEAAAKGRPETSDQSNIRRSMVRDYCVPGRPAAVWEPVLGGWVPSQVTRVAHLFPWRSVDSMDAIFGHGSRDEIFSSYNGLFLHHTIEDALDRGSGARSEDGRDP